MKKLLTAMLAIGLISAQAQNPFQKLKDKAKDLKVKENVQKAGSKLGSQLDKVRDKFDSVDFDYAILLSDNSGTFDVAEKGELGATLATWGSLGTSLIDSTKSDGSEKARFQLESGEVFYGLKKYAYAEKRYLSAITLYEAANLTGDIAYMKALANMGLLYTDMGRFTQAQTFTLQALEKRKIKLGPENIGVAASLNNAGVLNYNLGQYNDADRDIAMALSIISSKSKGSMPEAILLNNRAMIFQIIGRYDEAEKLMQEAIATAEKLQSSKSKNHFKFISNLALLYRFTGKYVQAEELYNGMEKKLGKNSAELASLLNNKAMLYWVMGKEEKVEDLLKKSVAMYKSSSGEESPASAKAINNLGNFLRYKERYADAEPLLIKSKNIFEKLFGSNHPVYVQGEEDLAILYWKQKQFLKAYPLYHEVMAKSLDFINRFFPPMSEAEKTKYWDVLTQRFQRFYNFAVESYVENKDILVDLFDYQVATKALLLNSTNKIKQAILSSGDKSVIAAYLVWLDQKETLARLYAYSKDDLKEQKINLDSIETATNATEKNLSQKSKDFSDAYSSEPPRFTQLKDLLSDQEAIVEIIQVKKFNQSFTKDTRYIVLVTTKAKNQPDIIVLENGTQLDTRYAKFYKNAIQQRATDTISYRAYWSTVDPLVAGKKLLYLSPDGVYNQININTLKKTGGDYLLKTYDITVIGNSRDLIAIKKQKPVTVTKKSAFLLGFPDYGGTAVAALPGTKVEIEAIDKILKTSGYKTGPLTQKLATEKSFKAAKGMQLVHIATHGYFLADAEVSAGSAIGVNVENAKENPLLRSGLILAGGGNTIAGENTPDLNSNDNGILTAYEAMNLSLDGTDLVILSACETGLGEVRAGEGVYGLQRAFLVAGAKALIMSLWKVDDAATQALMVNFYTNWVKSGNKQKAFKQAQLQLMTQYKDPYFWGAFVMMGN